MCRRERPLRRARSDGASINQINYAKKTGLMKIRRVFYYEIRRKTNGAVKFFAFAGGGQKEYL